MEPSLVDALDRSGRRLGFVSTMRNHAAAQLLGLHPTDWAALDLLDWAGPVGIGELAEQLGLSKAAATALVDRLEGGGYVERRPHSTDRRRVVVHPTGGRGRTYEGLDADLRSAMADHATGFSPDELTTILRFMEGAGEVLAEVTKALRQGRPFGSRSPRR